MTGRLSQRPGHLDRPGPWLGRGALSGRIPGPGLQPRLGLGLAGLLLLMLGCSGGDARDDTAAHGPGASDGASESSFDWPEDPDAPTLSIEIEGAGVEGRIEIELMPDLAPRSVGHVIALTREGLYDGTTFHRVIPGFMIQGGDPNSRDRDPSNDGRGGMRERVEDERSEAPFLRGVVAMANQGRPDSSGSQLFIMHADNRGLDGRYNVIGRVRSGMDVVDAIAEVETDAVGRWGPRDRPIENVVMTRVQVLGPRSGAAAHGARDGIAAGREDPPPGMNGVRADSVAVISTGGGGRVTSDSSVAR